MHLKESYLLPAVISGHLWWNGFRLRWPTVLPGKGALTLHDMKPDYELVGGEIIRRGQEMAGIQIQQAMACGVWSPGLISSCCPGYGVCHRDKRT